MYGSLEGDGDKIDGGGQPSGRMRPDKGALGCKRHLLHRSPSLQQATYVTAHRGKTCMK